MEREKLGQAAREFTVRQYSMETMLGRYEQLYREFGQGHAIGGYGVRRLRVLMLTRLFPSRALPTLGTFCLERAVALARHADVRVMVPDALVPEGIPAPVAWQGWGRVEREGVMATRFELPILAISRFRRWRPRFKDWPWSDRRNANWKLNTRLAPRHYRWPLCVPGWICCRASRPRTSVVPVLSLATARISASTQDCPSQAQCCAGR